MNIQGGIATRIINGFEFQFMHAFGYDGVLINPDEIHLDNSEFINALAEAKRLQVTWRSLGNLMNILAPLRSIRHEPDELLIEWRDKATFALQQQDWSLGADDLDALQSSIDLINFELSTRDARQKALSKPPVTGFVYVLKSPSGAYKIGKTKHPEDRLRTFAVKMPFEVEYICLIQTTDMNGLERSLHRHFKEKHVNGEWFNLSDADIEYIKGLSR